MGRSLGLEICSKIKIKIDETYHSATILKAGKIKEKRSRNSPHGKFHRFLFSFSSKFTDLNFARYDLYIYPCYETRTCVHIILGVNIALIFMLSLFAC